MSKSNGVYIVKRPTGCHKVCPDCQKRNSATSKQCTKCKAVMEEVKRQFGKSYSYSIRWWDEREKVFRSEKVGPDKALAEKRATEKREDIREGRYTGIRKITFKNFMDEDLKILKAKKYAPKSIDEYKTVYKQFLALCNPADLTAIDFPMLEDFVTKRLEEKVSDATINKALTMLQAGLNRAMKRDYLSSNPFDGNRSDLQFKLTKKNPIVFEHDEFKKLLAACPDDRWQAICKIGYFSGLRKEEILHLEWNDIDFENKILHVRNKADYKHYTKSRRERDVDMSNQVVEALKKLLPNRFKNELIFLNKFGGKMKNNVYRRFETIVKRAGLLKKAKDKSGKVIMVKDSDGREIPKMMAKYSLHNLRKSFVTNLLIGGTDIITVANLAGHADTKTTAEYYASVKDKIKREAIDRLDNLDAQTG